jgi:transcriptional regulator with GAF, ATPase, and Fis domain
MPEIMASDQIAENVRRPIITYPQAIDFRKFLKAVNRVLSEPAYQSPAQSDALSSLIGVSPQWTKVVERARRVAGKDIQLLVTGETGTGKSALAKAIFASSDRCTQPFKAVNCAAIPRELLESQLFGHKRGSFTGAVANQIGMFESAHNGVLFMDEIGELPLELQAKLLRVLDEGAIMRVGDNVERVVDVRLITATNKNLRLEIEASRFRSDLYYRLSVVEIYVPPLRDRPTDIQALVKAWLEQAKRDIDPTAMEKLTNHSWPGNVRELHHALARACVLSDNAVLTAEDIDIQ